MNITVKKKKRKCKGCSIDISHKHPNAKFHSNKCKDNYWNRENPRGYAVGEISEYEQIMDECESGWDAHKDWK